MELEMLDDIFQKELKTLISESVREVFRREIPSLLRQASQKKLLTPTDIENEFKISRRSLQHLRETRRIPFTKIGKRILIDRTDIERYIERSKINGGAK
jgi:excisionase family DNA binding protein